MGALGPAEAYSLWAPHYAAETVISALEYVAVESLSVDVRNRRLLLRQAVCDGCKQRQAAEPKRERERRRSDEHVVRRDVSTSFA